MPNETHLEGDETRTEDRQKAAETADMPSLEELATQNERVKQSLQNAGIRTYSNNGGRTSDDLKKAYDNIGISHIQSEIIKTLAGFVNKLKGKDAKKYMAEYSKEAQKMYDRFDDMLFAAQTTLFEKEKGRDKVGVEFWKIQGLVDSVDKLTATYGIRINDLNEKLREFRTLDEYTIDNLCREYAPEIAQEKNLDMSEKKNRLLYSLVQKKTELKHEKTEQERYKQSLVVKGKAKESLFFKTDKTLELAETHLQKLQMETVPVLTYIIAETQQTDMGFDPKTMYQAATDMISRVKTIQADTEVYINKINNDLTALQNSAMGENKVVPKNLNPKSNEPFIKEVQSQYGDMKVDLEQSASRMSEKMFGFN